MSLALKRNVAWTAIPVAGIIGGLALLLTFLVLSPVMYEVSGTAFLRYSASLVMGDGVLDEEGSGVLAVGALIHFILSVIFAVMIAVVVHRWGLLVGIVFGAILGGAIYAINFYTLTLLYEWFFAFNNTALFISHIVYGAVVGGVYEMLDRYDRPIGGL